MRIAANAAIAVSERLLCFNINHYSNRLLSQGAAERRLSILGNR